MDARIDLDLKQELSLQLSPYQLLTECRDPLMKEIVKRVNQFANVRVTLITGEHGTGKDLVARALNERGDRKNKPFIVLDCANLDEQVMRSELFGHEKGSFTGATERKIGFFEQADGGTAFLNEIGEVPIALQPRFLEVLQDRTFRRFGGHTPVVSDFRLITATNRDLGKMMSEGKFRQDLYYRMEAFTIHVPSLCDRKEDVVRLANHFTHQFSDKKKALDFDAEEAIRSHLWPGNVRELKSAIERAVVFANGDSLINARHLEIGIMGAEEAHKTFLNLEGFSLDQIMNAVIERIGRVPSQDVLDAGGIKDYLYKLAIESVLNTEGHNKLYAASKLGIGRQTLYNRMKRYKIPF